MAGEKFPAGLRFAIIGMSVVLVANIAKLVPGLLKLESQRVAFDLLGVGGAIVTILLLLYAGKQQP